MDISPRGVDFIVLFEGKHTLLPDGRYKAYLDKLAKPNVWTVYCGLTRGVHANMVCTEEEGQRMFAKELAIYEDAVERLINVPLNQNQFDALVSFTYNCGVGALEKSTLRRLLNQGKYEQVPAQLARWVYAGGVKYRGLVRRRAAEGALFMEPIDDQIIEDATPDGHDIGEERMPQSVTAGAASSAQETIKKSWTIRGGLIALATVSADMVTDFYNWSFGVLQDAGAEIGTVKQVLGPFDAILVTVKSALPVIAIIGIAIVMARRLSAAREGRVG